MLLLQGYVIAGHSPLTARESEPSTLGTIVGNDKNVRSKVKEELVSVYNYYACAGIP